MLQVTNKHATRIVVRVVCLECGKKFTARATITPACPKCGSVDIDVNDLGQYDE